MSSAGHPPVTTDDDSAPVRGRDTHGVKQALREILSWKTLVVLGAIALWAYNFRWVEDQFPFLLTAQLKVHQVLSNLDWHRQRVNWVTVVQIDDDSFWSPLFKGGTLPTNRAVLGDLGLLAADHGASVVAFDIQLDAPTTEGGDDKAREADNDHLLDAIRKIAQKKTPVVLAVDLDADGKGGWLQEPNIFRDDQLPEPATRRGYINLPTDPRQIPLASTAWGIDRKSEVTLQSFALVIVDAYEKATHVRVDDQTENRRSITRAIADNEFVYGGFLRKDKWDTVTAKQLMQGEALEKCNGRVVIIGSTWHDSSGHGDLADEHSSPLGPLAGVFLHGNYVEALLRDDFRPGVPGKVAVVIDLGIAVVFYFLFRSAKKRVVQVGVLLTVILLGLFAYLTFANMGIYFDSVAPISLVFVHLLVEAL